MTHYTPPMPRDMRRFRVDADCQPGDADYATIRRLRCAQRLLQFYLLMRLLRSFRTAERVMLLRLTRVDGMMLNTAGAAYHTAYARFWSRASCWSRDGSRRQSSIRRQRNANIQRRIGGVGLSFSSPTCALVPAVAEEFIIKTMSIIFAPRTTDLSVG